MKDQLKKMLEAGIPAALLNSSLSASQEKQALVAVTEGECQILFVTPAGSRATLHGDGRE